MSAATTRGYPYPQLTDSVDVPGDMQALAEAIDTDVTSTQEKPLVKLVQQSAQTLTSGTAAALTFGTSSTVLDTDNFHSESSNNTRVTPSVAGWYRVTGTLHMASGASSYSQVIALIRKNGANVDPANTLRPDAANTAATSAQTSTIVDCNGSTDYVEFIGQQNGPATGNTNTSSGFRSTFEVEFLRPLVS